MGLRALEFAQSSQNQCPTGTDSRPTQYVCEGAIQPSQRRSLSSSSSPPHIVQPPMSSSDSSSSYIIAGSKSATWTRSLTLYEDIINPGMKAISKTEN